MMETLLTRSWIDEFRRAASEKRANELEREKIDRIKLMDRQRQVERHVAEEQREREGWTAIENALAPPERVQAFRIELDNYDTKTVEALMENREALDVVQRRINCMLEDAYVLPDGRRVFKTEDGHRVFDEHGQAVPPEVIDPNQISNDKPRWERVREARAEAERLTAERQQLLDYQRQLDLARERLARGEITNGDLDRLKADLAEKMPDAIRQKLDHKDRDPVQAQKYDGVAASVAPAAALPADMDNLMRQTGFGPAVSRP